MTEAVVLLPGIMGSVLVDEEGVVWPGEPWELVLPYQKMHRLTKPDLQVTDVIRSVSISRQYHDLIESVNACGYRESDGTLKVLPYDWRKDNALAAELLANCVDALVGSLGADAEINLVAHSMGGLVSRCYLESGLYAERVGFPNVKRLITIGTPHRGAPMALAAALGQEKRLFLSAEQVRTLANDERFPALYQLLPPVVNPLRGTARRVRATHQPIFMTPASGNSSACLPRISNLQRHSMHIWMPPAALLICGTFSSPVTGKSLPAMCRYRVGTISSSSGRSTAKTLEMAPFRSGAPHSPAFKWSRLAVSMAIFTRIAG